MSNTPSSPKISDLPSKVRRPTSAEIKAVTDKILSTVEISEGKKLAPKTVKTIKDAIRAHFSNNPQQFKAFVENLIYNHAGLVFQMLEGRPAQDITSAGNVLPTPILNVLIDNSIKSK